MGRRRVSQSRPGEELYPLCRGGAEAIHRRALSDAHGSYAHDGRRLIDGRAGGDVCNVVAAAGIWWGGGVVAVGVVGRRRTDDVCARVAQETTGADLARLRHGRTGLGKLAKI